MTLVRGLEFEAKRHVSFIQQLWKWEQNKYHSEEFSKVLTLTQKNPNLFKKAPTLVTNWKIPISFEKKNILCQQGDCHTLLITDMISRYSMSRL